MKKHVSLLAVLTVVCLSVPVVAQPRHRSPSFLPPPIATPIERIVKKLKQFVGSISSQADQPSPPKP